MKGRAFAGLAVLLTLSAAGRAVSGPDCPDAVPVVPLPPVTLWRGQPAPPPVEATSAVRPEILLYRKEASPPLHAEYLPRPSVQLFECVRPPVTFFGRAAPGVELFRAQPRPPAPPCELPPRQPVTLFRVAPETPRYGPDVVAPPVTILHPAGLPACEGSRR